MTFLSGSKNVDVAVAVTAMREMYGLNVIISVRPHLVFPNICYLRVEWLPVQIWENDWYAAALMGSVQHVDLPLAPYDSISPAFLFRALMAAEMEMERFHNAAVAAGKPPEPQ